MTWPLGIHSIHALSFFFLFMHAQELKRGCCCWEGYQHMHVYEKRFNVYCNTNLQVLIISKIMNIIFFDSKLHHHAHKMGGVRWHDMAVVAYGLQNYQRWCELDVHQQGYLCRSYCHSSWACWAIQDAWACSASILYVSPFPSGFCQNLYLMHFFHLALSCSVIALIELLVLYLQDKYTFLLATDDPVRLISSLKYEGYGHFQEAD